MEGQLQVTLGRNLRRMRRQLGHSQEAFGELVGWHRTFVGAVERGERNLTLRTVERLAEQLGVHPLELLYDREGLTVLLAADKTVRFVERPVLRAAADDAGGGAADAPAVGGRAARPRPT